MEIYWRESAIESLKQLDKWRGSIDLPPIAHDLKKTIELYFWKQDFSLYIPGREVFIKKLPIDLRIVLISVGTSDPYKIFYRKVEIGIEIFLIRHPYQKTYINFLNRRLGGLLHFINTKTIGCSDFVYKYSRIF